MKSLNKAKLALANARSSYNKKPWLENWESAKTFCKAQGDIPEHELMVRVWNEAFRYQDLYDGAMREP